MDGRETVKRRTGKILGHCPKRHREMLPAGRKERMLLGKQDGRTSRHPVPPDATPRAHPHSHDVAAEEAQLRSDHQEAPDNPSQGNSTK